MRDLINLVAAHARACSLRMTQLDAELTEVRQMQKDRELEYGRLQRQAAACRTMLCYIRDDLPAGESRVALDQLIDRLSEPGEPVEDEDPAWESFEAVPLPSHNGQGKDPTEDDEEDTWELPGL